MAPNHASIHPRGGALREDDDILDLMKTKQPIGQGLIEPESVARAAIFLLSDDSGAITGDVLTVDAGWSVSA